MITMEMGVKNQCQHDLPVFKHKSVQTISQNVTLIYGAPPNDDYSIISPFHTRRKFILIYISMVFSNLTESISISKIYEIINKNVNFSLKINHINIYCKLELLFWKKWNKDQKYKFINIKTFSKTIIILVKEILFEK